MGGGPTAALDDEVGHADPVERLDCYGNRVRQPPCSPFPKVLLRPSAVPAVRWPAGGFRLLGSGGGHQGSSGTAACPPWPSGRRSWVTRAGCRPPRRYGGSWAGGGRPCRCVGLPPGIPFRAADPDAVPGPDWTEWSSGHEGGRGASDDAAVTLLRAVRTRRSCRPTPSAGHSPIGSFLRACYLVHGAEAKSPDPPEHGEAYATARPPRTRR
jgi:hypothetical protein